MGKAEFYSNLDGNNAVPAVRYFPVAASQTLLVGDVVVISSNKVTKAGAATGRVLGVMAQDSASASAGTLVAVYVARPTQLWRMTATADATSYVLGSRTFDLNSSQLVDVADTTGGSIYIESLVPGSTTSILVSFTTTDF